MDITPRNIAAVPEFRRRNGPKECRECVHYNFNSCGKCGSLARKSKEKTEDRNASQ